ncbi:hypothetical protein A9817_004280 [Escherichia coli]|nr:hypothetical protein [Escherichia coli]
MAAAASERVANTAGGRLAAEINGTAGKAREDQAILSKAGEIKHEQSVQEARELIAKHADSADAVEPQFDGNSVSSGNNEQSDEISDFVNRKA